MVDPKQVVARLLENDDDDFFIYRVEPKNNFTTLSSEGLKTCPVYNQGVYVSVDPIDRWPDDRHLIRFNHKDLILGVWDPGLTGPDEGGNFVIRTAKGKTAVVVKPESIEMWVDEKWTPLASVVNENPGLAAEWRAQFPTRSMAFPGSWKQPGNNPAFRNHRKPTA